MKRVMIELPDATADSLEGQSRLAGFASPDAYLATLLDADRLRLERLRVEAELARDAEANPRPPMTEEDWTRLKEEIDRRRPRPLPQLDDDLDVARGASAPVAHDGITDEQREEHRRRLGGRDACGD